jgi:alcohol dehydrogenase (NADP+)
MVISVGYRHVDCASVYGNEVHIGCTLRRIFDEGVRRHEFWITPKLRNHKHFEDDDAAGEPFHPLAVLFGPARY